MKFKEFCKYHSVENIDEIFRSAIIDYCSKFKGNKIKVLDIGGNTGSGWKELIDNINKDKLSVEFERRKGNWSTGLD